MLAFHLRPLGSRRQTAHCLAEASVQARLAVVIGLNLALIAAAFYLENQVWPWRMRMDQLTPGWALALAQAVVVGFVVALANRGGAVAVAQGLLAVTLLAYAYVLAGLWLIPASRVIQTAHLVSRAVELGLVGAMALTMGIAVRIIFCQRLSGGGDTAAAGRHYHVGDLLFLTAACGVGLGVSNLFAHDFERELQLGGLALTAARALPATLPWLWAVTLPRISLGVLAAVAVWSLAVASLKAVLSLAFGGGPEDEILWDTVLRAAAFAGGAAGNGLALRALGFRWQGG